MENYMNKLKTVFKTRAFWAAAAGLAGAFLGATGAVTMNTVGTLVCSVASCT